MFGPFVPKLRQHILILLSYFKTLSVGLVPVFQTLDSAIHQINDYLVITYEGNHYCAMHWMEIYPVDSVIHFSNNSALPGV